MACSTGINRNENHSKLVPNEERSDRLSSCPMVRERPPQSEDREQCPPKRIEKAMQEHTRNEEGGVG